MNISICWMQSDSTDMICFAHCIIC